MTIMRLKGILVLFTCPDSESLLDRENKYFSITYLSGIGIFFYGLYYIGDEVCPFCLPKTLTSVIVIPLIPSFRTESFTFSTFKRSMI